MIDTREIVQYAATKYVRGNTLDIGGGTAKYRSIIEPHTTKYTVADLYKTPEVDVVEDARNMSFPSESFDTVLVFQLLEHVDDTQAVVKEIYRVLKGGGCAIVTVPFLYAQHGNPQDFHRFTLEGLRYAFKNFIELEGGEQGSTLSVFSNALRCLYVPQDGLEIIKYGRIKMAFWRRVFALLKSLDKRGWGYNKNFYANVYLIVEKPRK